MFEDRHIVVTGGAGALGRAVVVRLVAAGATVHVPVRGAGEADALADSGHERIVAVPGVDLADADGVATFYERIGPLWASIHVAGGFGMAKIADTAPEDFARLMETNARTCFLCCRAAVAAMRRAGGGGRIVNVAARPALEPRSGSGMVAYTASKAAVAALTAALAQEVIGDGILVNAVAPSIIDTPANREAMPGAKHEAWPKPDEIAATIVHLASPANAVTRGAVIPVYGRS